MQRVECRVILGLFDLGVCRACSSKEEAGNVSVSISPSELTLSQGKSALLQATVTPSTAAAKGVMWKSSNTTVATVTSNGVVTALADQVDLSDTDKYFTLLPEYVSSKALNYSSSNETVFSVDKNDSEVDCSFITKNATKNYTRPFIIF